MMRATDGMGARHSLPRIASHQSAGSDSEIPHTAFEDIHIQVCLRSSLENVDEWVLILTSGC